MISGIVAPQAATASTAALLTFVLPVAVAQPASAVGPRLRGVDNCCGLLRNGVHAGLAPPLARRPPPPAGRGRLCVARLVDAGSRGANDQAASEDVAVELASCAAVLGTPYPPTGAAASAVALSKLVGRVEWVAGNTAMMRDEHWSTEPRPARAVTEKVAETLHQIARADL